MSDDGRYALVLILFVGHVFSPWYARARAAAARSGGGAASAGASAGADGTALARPEAHLAVNAALYGPRRAWAMTERPDGAAFRTPDTFVLGDTAARWEGGVLRVRLDEPRAAFGGGLRRAPGRVRGEIALYADHLFDRTTTLDAGGRHAWHPVAPVARAEVRLDDPAVSFEGAAYHDANTGGAALESDFRRWTWSRAALGDATVVTYDSVRADDSEARLALAFRRDGRVEVVDPGPALGLTRSRWGLARAGRLGEVTRDRCVEDTPFYARSLVHTRLLGEEAVAMHEALDLTRFARGWVRFLLPFRMRREAAGTAREEETT